MKDRKTIKSAAAGLAVAVRERKEAVELQAATAEILAAMSKSRGDARPVFDAIVRNAAKLCESEYANVFRYDGRLLHWVAGVGRNVRAQAAIKKAYPMVPDGTRVVGRVILTGRVVRLEDTHKDRRYDRKFASVVRRRRILGVPLLHGRKPIGVITIGWAEPGPILRRHEQVLKSFAIQAVMAIENVQLFNETKEALEHQKTSADILKIVAGSVESADPVFEAIAMAGKRLLPGFRVAVNLLRDGKVHYVAHAGISAERKAQLAKLFPIPVDEETVIGTAMLRRRIVAVPDITAEGLPYKRSIITSRASGYQAMLAVPLISGGEAIGCLSVSRPTSGPFSDKQVDLAQTFADQAVVAIQNARLFNETKEALERQTATGEILSSISRGIANTQPVFDAIARNVRRLLDTRYAVVLLLRGDSLQLAAVHGDAEFARKVGGSYGQFRDSFPQPVDYSGITGKALRSGRIMQIVPIVGNPRASPRAVALAKGFGYDAMLVAPLMRDGQAIGCIGTVRPEATRFSEKELRLLKTFADQAVIAIENTRLFNETKEALERQTATGEILSVISSSPTDVQPVFDTIAQSVVRLCDGLYSGVFRFDGQLIHLAAHHNFTPKALEVFRRAYPRALSRETQAATAILDRTVVEVRDFENDPTVAPTSLGLARSLGFRSNLTVPMLREGNPIGAISIARATAGAFSEKQVDLLKTFADQAVIAIENVRLFNETKEALERQTATAEILRVIGSSMTDAQPVFKAIVDNCERLFATNRVALWLISDGRLFCRASTGFVGEPMPIDRESAMGACVIEGRTIHLPDLESAAEHYPRIRQLGLKHGYGSGLYAPLLREGRAIGGISVLRKEAGAFDDKGMILLGTFADQAVIAIENVRLFNETQEALEQQTVIGEVLRVISDSPTDVKPVLDAVAARAAKICEASDARIWLVEGDHLRHAAGFGDVPMPVELRDAMPLDRGTVSGRAVVDLRPVHVEDMAAASAEDFPIAYQFQKQSGYRTILAVPLLREGRALGAIMLRRMDVRAFTEKQIRLLGTFADQAAIAIENVRLFNETKEALERQTATAEILRVIASSPSDVQPVFDMIARSARQLFNARYSVVTRRVDDMLHLVAHTATGKAGIAALEKLFPANLTGQGAAGKAVLTGNPAWIVDVETDPAYSPAFRAGARARGYRSQLTVPMIRKGVSIGAITVTRSEPGTFSAHQIGLLQTFADQAVIAIENARSFNETKEALERQTATAEILRVIAASPSDVQPVFDVIGKSAMQLIGGRSASVMRLHGDDVHLEALTSTNPAGDQALRSMFPRPRRQVLGVLREVMASGKSGFVEDTETYSSPEFREMARARGHRSVVAVPMLRDGAAVGTIAVTRERPGGFSRHEVLTLETFADQAVIAIENVRLFNETKEALERQTATAEILKVISSSPTDTQPVLEAIVRSAARLFSMSNATIFMRDGDLIHLRAVTGVTVDDAMRRQLSSIYPIPFNPEVSTSARAMAERRINFCLDTEAPDVPEHIRRAGRAGRFRSNTVVPLVREDEGIGTIVITHPQPGYRLNEKQLALLQTFADQAVIAIENVRLFNELQTRNKDLTEALEQQTATGEILKVISSSRTDVQPVFETIARNSVRLCNGGFGGLFTFDGKMMDIVALVQPDPEARRMFLAAFPQAITPTTPSAIAILERRVVNVPDVLAEDYSEEVKQRARAGNYRSVLTVPMMRGDTPIGAIAVTRPEAEAFSDAYIALLKTFADQAVIAIENVRLFKELEARNKDLGESLEQQTATSEVLKVISRTTIDIEPVLRIVLENARRLCDADRAAVGQPNAEGGYVFTASAGVSEESIAAIRSRPFALDTASATGRAVLERRTIHIPDVQADADYGRIDIAHAGGFRTILAVPMLREGTCIGVLTLSRVGDARPFSEKQVALVTTFADQAVIAIENVRLFKEIQEKSAQLEIANRHKSEFLANMSHELRTPLNAIIGFSEVLSERMFGEVNEKQADYLKDIHESGKHLLSLINDILDLSKIEAGRMELEVSSFHLPSAISNAMTLVRERAQRHGVQLGSEIDPRLGELRADERKVKQILLNLLSNAVKFTPEGGKVDVLARKFDGKIEIAVHDTGVGISPEDQARLFEEFRQVGSDAARKAEGTGLGLALTKKFVELHGGAIRVESAPGKGSTFSFSLPLAAAGRPASSG